MQAIIHAAGIQDRDGGVLLMGSLFGLYPFLLKLYADSGYQGPKFQAGLRAVCGGCGAARRGGTVGKSCAPWDSARRCGAWASSEAPTLEDGRRSVRRRGSWRGGGRVSLRSIPQMVAP